jgi:dolichyl-diphosphooligosaccharide--protein glycosyltransferase
MSPELDHNWYDALWWMALNTPQPFGDPDKYYRPNRDPSSIAAYGVLAWWDHGYWITRVARRVPVTNPRQSGMRDAASFFMSTNEADANRIAERLGVRYVAVDSLLQASTTRTTSQRGFFRAIAIAAGRTPSDFCNLFVDESARRETPAAPVVYCYPDYYRTMAMRLYLYGGRAATPARDVVVLSSRREVRDGQPLNVVTGEWRFGTYDEASRFVTSSGRTDLRIVSKRPQETCVPLEALTSYTSVYTSLGRDGGRPTDPPAVQVLEYRRQAAAPR